jgi:hypothetical protein
MARKVGEAVRIVSHRKWLLSLGCCLCVVSRLAAQVISPEAKPKGDKTEPPQVDFFRQLQVLQKVELKRQETWWEKDESLKKVERWALPILLALGGDFWWLGGVESQMEGHCEIERITDPPYRRNRFRC